MGKRKCVLCGETIDNNNESIPYKNRYAHKECFNILMKNSLLKETRTTSKKTKDKSKEERGVCNPIVLKKGLTEEEYKKKKSFFDTLKQITPLHSIEAKDYAISENYINKYKFTWDGMEYTLKYVFEVLDNNNFVNTPLMVIPNYYNEACVFYGQIQEAQKHNEQIISNDSLIGIKKQVIYKRPSNNKKLIDISKIGCETDC